MIRAALEALVGALTIAVGVLGREVIRLRDRVRELELRPPSDGGE